MESKYSGSYIACLQCDCGNEESEGVFVVDLNMTNRLLL
jgi:hypothetical protein